MNGPGYPARPGRVLADRIPWLALGFGLICWLAAPGCKCDRESGPGASQQPAGAEYEPTLTRLPGASQVDVARLIPQGVDLALVAERPDKVWAWLGQQAWWQQVQKSPVWTDLALSGPLVELSNVRHRLASLSPVDFKQPKIEDLLPTSMGLAANRQADGWQILLIKQIDLKFQSLARLAEVFNQVRPDERLRSRQLHGTTLRSFDLGESGQLHYAVYSNLLLVSNHEGLLDQAVALASGNSNESILRADDLARLLAGQAPAELVVMLRPAGLSRWLATLLPVKALRISLRLEPVPEASLVGLPISLPISLPASLPAKPRPAGIGQALKALIPLDSRLVVGRADLDLAALWRELSEQAPGKGQARPPDLQAGLFDRLSGEAILVVTGVELPVPQAAGLLRLRDQTGVEDALGQALGYLFGSQPTQRAADGLPGRTIWSVAGEAFSPSFAIQDGWLVVGTSPAAVLGILATAAGKVPALTDQPGFEERVLARAEPFFGLLFVDGQLLFADLKAASRALIGRSQRFDANDLDDTLGPLFDALAAIGKLGVGLVLDRDRVTGSVVAL